MSARSIGLWIALPLALAAILGGAIWWFHHPAAPQDQGQGPSQAQGQGPSQAQGQGQGRGGRGAAGAPPVAVASVSTGDIKVTLNALGTVTPLATVTVQTQISGQLIQIGFREGQRVVKGDFLAQIDPRPYQAALEQAQGQLVKDQAFLDQAQMDLVRYLKLAEKNSIARQQSEDQQWVVHQDEGQVKVDQAQVATAQLNLNYCRIVAPSNGRIGLRLVDQGNYVQANTSGTGLAVITQTQPITVIFVLPEDSLPRVLKRLHDGAQLAVQAYDRSGSQLLDTGTLLAVDSQINTSTGTVNLKAQFPNQAEALFPNQFVNTVLVVDELHAVTVMPTAAIQRGAPGTFVYLVAPDGTVAVRTVKLGPLDGERVAVEQGLKVGDQVVIDGADKLRDGAKVVVRGGGAADGNGSSPPPAQDGAAAPPGPAQPQSNTTGQPAQPAQATDAKDPAKPRRRANHAPAETNP